MKKKLGLFITLVFVLSLASCGAKTSGKAEAEKLAKDMTSLMDTTAKKLDASSSAKEAADVLISYANAQKDIIIRSKELSKKYPDLKINDPSTQAQSEEAKKLVDHFTKSLAQTTMKYMMAPEMQAALKKMGEIMQSVK